MVKVVGKFITSSGLVSTSAGTNKAGATVRGQHAGTILAEARKSTMVDVQQVTWDDMVVAQEEFDNEEDETACGLVWSEPGAEPQLC